ncbi:hypothetical protein VVR12_03335 [Rothia sp. LK2588]|uniref:hypothetical protein n=1 Tax=Rothia sp. LK2588 TaxID=3114369 RepID=UPI0034CF75CD
MHLPPDSATMRAEGGNASLTGVEHQLRAINHRLDLVLYQNGGAKGSAPAEPKEPETHMQARQRQERLRRRAARHANIGGGERKTITP